jgi:hypothetical protein
MAQTQLTHAKMIQNLIGDFEPTEHPELFKAGFDFVADIIPADSALWSNANVKKTTVTSSGVRVRGGDGSSMGGAQRNYKILSVWRSTTGVSGLYENLTSFKCKEITWEDYQHGFDSESIHFHARELKYPVYSISDEGQLVISPTIGSDGAYLRYYYYEPADYFDLSESGNEFLSQHITDAGIVESYNDNTWGPLDEIPSQFHEALAFKVIAMGYKDPRNMKIELAQYFDAEYDKVCKQAKKYARSNFQSTGQIVPQEF